MRKQHLYTVLFFSLKNIDFYKKNIIYVIVNIKNFLNMTKLKQISISFNDLQEIQEVMERISKLYRELKSKYLAENKDGAWAYHRVRIFEASLVRLREDGQLMNMNTATLIHLFFDGDFDRFQTELKEFIGRNIMDCGDKDLNQYLFPREENDGQREKLNKWIPQIFRRKV